MPGLASSAISTIQHGVEKLVAPEVAMYNWGKHKVEDLLGVKDDNATASAAVVAGPGDVGGISMSGEKYHDLPQGEYRFIEYFAKSCPHCVDLQPKFSQAAKDWDRIEQIANGNINMAEANLGTIDLVKSKPHVAGVDGKIHVKFEAAECLDGDWKSGPDHELCRQEGVHGFPTLKLFGPHGAEYKFQGPRSSNDMINFVKYHTQVDDHAVDGTPNHPDYVDPEEELDRLLATAPPPEHVDPPTNQMVEYYAASCPHCTTLKPIWQQAQDEFAKDHSEAAADTKWIQKECLDDQWKPGKDFQECVNENIGAFPSVKFESKSGVAHEYHGDRTAKGMREWLEQEVKNLPQAEKDVVEQKAAVKKFIAMMEEKYKAQEAAQQAENALPDDTKAESQDAKLDSIVENKAVEVKPEDIKLEDDSIVNTDSDTKTVADAEAQVETDSKTAETSGINSISDENEPTGSDQPSTSDDMKESSDSTEQTGDNMEQDNSKPLTPEELQRQKEEDEKMMAEFQAFLKQLQEDMEKEGGSLKDLEQGMKGMGSESGAMDLNENMASIGGKGVHTSAASLDSEQGSLDHATAMLENENNKMNIIDDSKLSLASMGGILGEAGLAMMSVLSAVGTSALAKGEQGSFTKQSVQYQRDDFL